MLLHSSNREIAQLLNSIAAAYQVLGENRFKIIAYERAADMIDQLTVELTTLWEKGELTKLPGIGPSIVGHLSELMKTGKVSHFEAVFAKMPHGMMSLLKLTKVGGKTAFKLAVALNKVHALPRHASDEVVFTALEQAIKNGNIDSLEGFGAKKSQELLISIAAFRKGATKEIRMPLPVADQIAREAIRYLQQLPEVKKIDALGSLRRKVATIGDIDIAVATTDKKKVIAHFIAYPHAQSVVESGDQGATIALSSGTTIDLRVGELRSYGAMLQYFTGSKQHNINLREYALKKGMSVSEYGIKDVKTGLLHEFSDEKRFYNHLGLHYVEPELRENNGEVELAVAHKLPKLVELHDIKGDVHIHSDFDLKPSHDLGTSSMNEILSVATKYNYTYVGISDHNPKQSGLTDNDIDVIMKRRKEYFDNKKYSTKSVQNKCTVQKVFVMLEIDIKPDGELALPVKSFSHIDAAIASIHSGFDMPAPAMTKRIIHALSHPKVRILGHPTGRLINRRESIRADWEDIFRFCKAKNMALEINAHFSRLDLPDVLVRKAVQMGVKLIIDTDAHAAQDLNLMTYGVSVARRGWATKDDIINTRSLEEFEKWLKN